MATIQQIKDAINSANTLGRTNLAEKGVTVDDTATTYQIMQKISEVSGGSSGTVVNSSVEIIEPININNNIVVSSRVVATANAIIKE